MPITHFNQNTTSPGTTEKGLGSASSAEMSLAFPSSPIHAGQYSADTVKDLAQTLLKTGEVPQAAGYYSLPGFSRDYNNNGPPSAGDVVTGGEGKPGSPWGPNPSSPDNPGSINPTDVPKPPTEGYPPEAQGLGSRAFPGDTSESIADQTLLGSLLTGHSFAGSQASG